MTDNEYAKALARAHAEHITILGWAESDGRTVWTVVNDSKGTEYSVTRTGDEGPLTCSCDAGQHRKVCKHVALVLDETRKPPTRRRTADEISCERKAECFALTYGERAFSLWK